MKSNVGGIDRILRIVIGLVLVGLAATSAVGSALCRWLPGPLAGAHPMPSLAGAPVHSRNPGDKPGGSGVAY